MIDLKRTNNSALIIRVQPIRCLRVNLRQALMQRLRTMLSRITLLLLPKGIIGAIIGELVLIAQGFYI
ncbi:hypothetical protein D3C80_2217230 [compost metagenome]